ncbi:hypothetical protein N7462_010842 [Penicillium macrosclerotiorum]|uniref:uncharacterized protein n=1 Tax=Penicillium macrosclerotiorum TaxID=303699 RepID=UPI002548E272|nr:uncharacterized protein N7462_010842 [Penicillium macrosclerotiorum]KAJ5669772.1 hypothetical protein N7462_010842 [Penicillium macrosclerotiorum]
MSFDGEKIVGLRAWPHNTRANGRARVSRGVANEEDICNALFSVLELCQGTAEQITLVGVADAAGIAAIAKWLLDLKIILYTTDNETVENRLWYRNCEEKDAQLIVIYTRNIDSSAIIQSRRTVHLPDVTVLFRTGAQMRPSHDYVVSGRLRWEEALSGTFRDEFAALIAFPKLLGAAIGSAARVFTALAEADPNIPSDQLRRQSAYFPESHGEDFVYFCRERFPELQKADLESAMFRAARIGTYEEAFNAFNDTASQLAQACNCSTCCLGKYPRAGQHIATREEQRLNRDSSTRCLVVLMTTIIRLARGLYGILSIEGLGPRRKGLEYVYRVQTQRILQVNTRSSKKGRFVTFVDSLIEYAIPSTIQTECSLLRFAQWIFRSEEFLEEQEDPGITAISDDGICFFYDVLRDPQQKDPVMLCRVNVIPGHIQYHQRVFQAVNEKTQKLSSVVDDERPNTARTHSTSFLLAPLLYTLENNLSFEGITMANVALIGCTGMVGSHILTSLLSNSGVSRVDTISRRTPQAAADAPHTKLTTFVSDKTETWAEQLSALSPTPEIFISAFATTRANAGGFENQHKIEHGLNIEMARAAHDAGSKVYVLISSANASKDSSIPYSRMKGEIEEDVKSLGFERTVILRPGLISGTREESRPLEAGIRFIAGWAGKVHSSLKDGWAQDADVIAEAAVKAGLKALEGDVPAGSEKVWTLDGKNIITLAKE